MSREADSPPPGTTSSYPSLQHSYITHKSHRLRTSPVPGEGSTFVPVVKFTSQFTQRNALRGTKPVYGTAHVDQLPHEADIVSVHRGGRGHDARAHGWTISITSSSHTEEDLQVEVQEHFEPPQRLHRPRTPLMSEIVPPSQTQVLSPLQVLPPLQGLGGGLLGGAESQISSGPSTQQQQPRPQTQPRTQTPQPIFPRPDFVLPIPTLAHDRVILTEEDISRIRIKCLTALLLGIIFPPIWVLMGWGHSLDKFLLPLGYQTNQLQQMMQTYTPYRRVASVLAGLVVLGTCVGIIVGGLALGGIV
jgi:hypothetical protein